MGWEITQARMAADAFAIDPTSLPLRRGTQHRPVLCGALQDCGPDRWGRLLIERVVCKQLLARKLYQDLDYVVALDDTSRIGALRFRAEVDGPFLAAGDGKIPPLVSLRALLNAADAVHGKTDTAADLRYLLSGRPGYGSTCRRNSSHRSLPRNLLPATFIGSVGIFAMTSAILNVLSTVSLPTARFAPFPKIT